MERGDKHGPRLDDALAGETEAISRGGHTGRAEESREPEPSGEGQPDVDYAPDGELVGGTPDGMTAADVEGRAELARFLRPSAFPGTAGELLAVARDEGATDRVLAELGRLRSGSGGGDRRFENVQDVWRALGHGVETHRN
ncbi:MAG TPA: hypothetical protein VF218_15595 [Acidothermaceae bacterium]|jgi:hypothetical protein